MNKLYEYCVKQEEINQDIFSQSNNDMFNGMAAGFWAVRQFMEVNDLTERLYTKEEMLAVMNIGMDARNGQLRGDEHRSGNQILEEYLTELNK